ncbi:hypothetical protein L218DRAFT_965465 [Marasmius fiardii PR-910]|nr:hypothetical protein L218DRAFT_965465 [Marasmius fiardii PR-910]
MCSRRNVGLQPTYEYRLRMGEVLMLFGLMGLWVGQGIELAKRWELLFPKNFSVQSESAARRLAIFDELATSRIFGKKDGEASPVTTRSRTLNRTDLCYLYYFGKMADGYFMGRNVTCSHLFLHVPRDTETLTQCFLYVKLW